MKKKIRLLKAYGGFKAGEIVEGVWDEIKHLTEGEDPTAELYVALSKSDNTDSDETQPNLEEIVAKAAEKAVSAITETLKPKGSGIVVGEDRETLKEYKNIGEQMIAVRNASIPGGTVDKRLLKLRVKSPSGLNTEEGPEGGFLVDTTPQAGLRKRMYDNTVIASRCFKVTVGQGSNGITWNEIDETSRVPGSQFGGVVAYWVSQGGTITASKPTFREEELKLKKLAAAYYATEEQLQDSVALTSLVEPAVSGTLAWKFDNSIVNGTGAGQALGIMNSPALISTSRTGTGVSGLDLPTMWSRLWVGCRSTAIFIYDQSIEPDLFTLNFAGDGGKSDIPIHAPGSVFNTTPYATWQTRPLIPVEHCQAVGTSGDIILFDPASYIIIEKGGVNVAESMHVEFLTDQQVFRFTYRVNGKPMWYSTLTPANGSANTLSSMVTIAS